MPRQQTTYKFYPDTDSLCLYFSDVFPGATGSAEQYNIELGGVVYHDGVEIELDAFENVLKVEVSPASIILLPHLWEGHSIVEDRPPVLITEEYKPNVKNLSVNLVGISHVVGTSALQITDKVTLRLDGASRIFGFDINSPSNIFEETTADMKRELEKQEQDFAANLCESFLGTQ